MTPEGYVSVTCPHCWQVFSIPGPAPSETPTQWDYDCEVCCRPMVIAFEPDPDDETVWAEAQSLED